MSSVPDPLDAWIAELHDDDAAPRLIVEALDETSPPPSWVNGAAHLAWGTRDLDAELALLVESAAVASGVRAAAAEAVRLQFVTPRATIEVDAFASGDLVELEVSVRWNGESPGAGVTCVVEMPTEQIAADEAADGSFLADVSPGRCRVRMLGAGRDLLTEWFHV